MKNSKSGNQRQVYIHKTTPIPKRTRQFCHISSNTSGLQGESNSILYNPKKLTSTPTATSNEIMGEVGGRNDSISLSHLDRYKNSLCTFNSNEFNFPKISTPFTNRPNFRKMNNSTKSSVGSRKSTSSSNSNEKQRLSSLKISSLNTPYKSKRSIDYKFKQKSSLDNKLPSSNHRKHFSALLGSPRRDRNSGLFTSSKYSPNPATMFPLLNSPKKLVSKEHSYTNSFRNSPKKLISKEPSSTKLSTFKVPHKLGPSTKIDQTKVHSSNGNDIYNEDNTNEDNNNENNNNEIYNENNNNEIYNENNTNDINNENSNQSISERASLAYKRHILRMSKISQKMSLDSSIGNVFKCRFEPSKCNSPMRHSTKDFLNSFNQSNNNSINSFSSNLTKSSRDLNNPYDSARELINKDAYGHNLINEHDSAHDLINQSDYAHNLIHKNLLAHNLINQDDSAHDLINQSYTAHNLINQSDSAHNLINQSDSAHNLINQNDSARNLRNKNMSAHNLIKQKDSMHSLTNTGNKNNANTNNKLVTPNLQRLSQTSNASLSNNPSSISYPIENIADFFNTIQNEANQSTIPQIHHKYNYNISESFNNRDLFDYNTLKNNPNHNNLENYGDCNIRSELASQLLNDISLSREPSLAENEDITSNSQNMNYNSQLLFELIQHNLVSFEVALKFIVGLSANFYNCYNDITRANEDSILAIESDMIDNIKLMNVVPDELVKKFLYFGKQCATNIDRSCENDDTTLTTASLRNISNYFTANNLNETHVTDVINTENINNLNDNTKNGFANENNKKFIVNDNNEVINNNKANLYDSNALSPTIKKTYTSTPNNPTSKNLKRLATKLNTDHFSDNIVDFESRNESNNNANINQGNNNANINKSRNNNNDRAGGGRLRKRSTHARHTSLNKSTKPKANTNIIQDDDNICDIEPPNSNTNPQTINRSNPGYHNNSSRRLSPRNTSLLFQRPPSNIMSDNVIAHVEVTESSTTETIVGAVFTIDGNAAIAENETNKVESVKKQRKVKNEKTYENKRRSTRVKKQPAELLANKMNIDLIQNKKSKKPANNEDSDDKPKKRGAPKKTAKMAGKQTSDDASAAPPKKRGRPAKKV